MRQAADPDCMGPFLGHLPPFALQFHQKAHQKQEPTLNIPRPDDLAQNVKGCTALRPKQSIACPSPSPIAANITLDFLCV